MSNVLIGIIGVILFIGLALAGALFLGPRFQSATNTSKAAATIQAAKQLADAASLYRLNEGENIGMQTLGDLETKRYIKAIPELSGAYAVVLDETGCSGCTGTRAAAVGYHIGTSDSSRILCEEIARQTGQGAPSTGPMTRGNQTVTIGCGISGTAPHYYVFSFF